MFSRDNPDDSKVVEARIVKVNDITDDQRRSVSDYASRFFGVEYPKWYEFPWDRERKDKIYCTALAWQAHRYAGKYVDLDVDGGPMVMPRDLVRSSKTTVISIFFD